MYLGQIYEQSGCFGVSAEQKFGVGCRFILLRGILDYSKFILDCSRSRLDCTKRILDCSRSCLGLFCAVLI